MYLSVFLFAGPVLAEGNALTASHPSASRPSPTATVNRSLIPAMGATKKYGYIDAQSRNFVLAPRFAEASFFVDGIAIVRMARPEKGMGLLEPGGDLIFQGDYEIKPAWPNGNLRPNYFDQGAEVYGRVFSVRQDSNLGVFHADKGWLLPPDGALKHIRFEGPLTFYGGSRLVVEGQLVPLPQGFKVVRLDQQAGLVVIEEAESGDGPPLTGVLHLDGSILIAPNYHVIDQAQESGVWVASRLSDNTARRLKKVMKSGGARLSGSENCIEADVFDASGRLLRSFKSNQYPDVTGAQYAYRIGGIKHTVNAATGTIVPEASLKEDKDLPKQVYQGAEVGTAPNYYGHEPFNRFGQALSGAAEGKYTVIDTSGRVLLPQATSISDVSARGEGLLLDDPLYIVQRDKLWGLMNGKGDVLLPFEYGYIRLEENTASLGYWFVFEDVRREKRGAYNYAKKITLPPIYSRLSFYPENIVAYAWTQEGRVAVLLNAEGRKLGEYGYIQPSRANPPVYIVQQGNHVALVDARGQVIAPLRYSFIAEVDPVYFLAVDDNGMVFYIDRNGVEYRPGANDKK